MKFPGMFIVPLLAPYMGLRKTISFSMGFSSVVNAYNRANHHIFKASPDFRKAETYNIEATQLCDRLHEKYPDASVFTTEASLMLINQKRYISESSKQAL